MTVQSTAQSDLESAPTQLDSADENDRMVHDIDRQAIEISGHARVSTPSDEDKSDKYKSDFIDP